PSVTSEVEIVDSRLQFVQFDTQSQHGVAVRNVGLASSARDRCRAWLGQHQYLIVAFGASDGQTEGQIQICGGQRETRLGGLPLSPKVPDLGNVPESRPEHIRERPPHENPREADKDRGSKPTHRVAPIDASLMASGLVLSPVLQKLGIAGRTPNCVLPGRIGSWGAI